MWSNQRPISCFDQSSSCLNSRGYGGLGGDSAGSDFSHNGRRNKRGAATTSKSTAAQPYISLSTSNVPTTKKEELQQTNAGGAEKEREKSFDGLLAEAFSKVSLEERDESLHELHGIITDNTAARQQQIEEEHDLLRKKMNDMVEQFLISSEETELLRGYNILPQEKPNTLILDHANFLG